MIKPIPNLSMIIARDLNGNIGKGNKIPWDCKNDVQWFKKVTADKGLIAGRKTFEGLPNVVKRRVELVLTKSSSSVAAADYRHEVRADLQQAVSYAAQCCTFGDELMVIGGAQIYKEFMPYISKIYLSTIATVIDDADAAFLDFSGDWIVVESVAHGDCVLSTLIRK